jgi:tetratricopeptide (TPR) repeat protein
MSNASRWALLGMLAVLALTWMAYLPGLQGGFLFDDYANLPALGAMGPIDDTAAFWRYVTSGTADPTGRPVALVSFLLDAHDWPAAAAPFKRTNLLLHLANGVLLALLLRQLGRALLAGRGKLPAEGAASRADWAAVLGAAMWLLHPLFVSTTLYIVQREAMLPALFTMAGLLLWLRGRQAFDQSRRAAGWCFIAAGLVACTALAVLSKANGVLLPALALTIEFAFLRPVAPSPAKPAGPLRSPYALAMTVFAVVPSLLVAAYLLYQGWHGLVHGISAARPWTLGQRLLTEPRILVDYLALLWLPRPFTPGLFNDHIVASASLWSPAGTLPSLLAICVLIGAAIVLRKRLPAVATAILFYFVGQSIESSTIALELYFEHRNYLPAMLMFWPLALFLCDLPQGLQPIARRQAAKAMAPRTRRWLKAILAAALLAGLGGMTYARAALWGNTHDQALLWARLNPDSARAQANAAQAEMAAGRPAQAVARLRPMLAADPDQVQLSFNLIGAECQLGHLREETLEAAATSLRTTRNPGCLLEHWFERALKQAEQPGCPQMNLAALGRLLDAARGNPRLMAVAGRRVDIDHLQGRIALEQGKPDEALADFNRALDQEVRATAALQQAALLGAAGYPAQALAHLDHFEAARGKQAIPASGMPRVHAWVLQHQHYWDRELARLRNTLLADQRARNANPA